MTHAAGWRPDPTGMPRLRAVSARKLAGVARVRLEQSRKAGALR
ncbi:hypothetical protein H4696_006170 [Amycolatopsis lexingtonensis]|uniref:Uncharacterized protein n=1 Tax=Amycolatopsis lexingtonensis TaxID=218822 RepID=A0ABR9I7B6_9PSEU|nr:hypothetical protein [Amycolatopsis lexingtonensis]